MTDVCLFFLIWQVFAGGDMPLALEKVANQVETTYSEQAIEVTKDLIAFPTVKKAGMENRDNPHFQAMSIYLEKMARKLDFDFKDYGDVVVIGLGNLKDRLGLVTHGDVVAVSPDSWKKSPFQLDRQSQPGKLIGRGVEDDKGPIALALFAMKGLAESGWPQKKRVELIISYTEESSWEPFRQFLKKVPPPSLNIALDASYPVTVAEKGWSGVWIQFENNSQNKEIAANRLTRFSGGAFLSQVPQQAKAVLSNVDNQTLKHLQKTAVSLSKASFSFSMDNTTLTITATGKAAHSSTPEKGVNAIAYLAALLGSIELSSHTSQAQAVGFINQLVGTGYNGETFGKTAFSHPFMGALTLNLGTAIEENGTLTLGLNFRSPAGKTAAQLESEVVAAINQWTKKTKASVKISQKSFSGAHFPENPAHVEPLLTVFSHFTGLKKAKPVSIGGGTHARLVPNGINFGPSMPDVAYSGHSEHEYMTESQFRLNLRMYTAALLWLACEVPKN